MKTIMIIGAGKSQIPLIEASKRENYYTIVCDINANAPGAFLADEFFEVSTKDRFGLLEVARAQHIDGIVANSEYAMCDVAFISNKMGLIGNPEKTIDVLSSKSKFRSFQMGNGLYAPNFVVITSIDELKNKLPTFPVVIKPDQSAGSRGTTLIHSFDEYTEISQAVLNCTKISRNGRAIIEEYVPMQNCVVIEGELFVHNGEILWDGLFLTVRSKKALMIPMTYIFPMQETEDRIEGVKQILTKAFLSAGVSHGEYNIEMYFTSEDTPFIIEINPRQGGNSLPKYVQKYCGIDYYKLLVTTAMGDDYYWDSIRTYVRNNRYIVHHLLFPRITGRLKGVHISESLMDKVSCIQIDRRIGEEISKTIDATSCIGFVDLEFNNSEEQIKNSIEIEDSIVVEISGNTPIIEKY